MTVGCLLAFAYLVTALSGHPFLVLEAAIPFWVVVGILVIAGRRADPPGHRGAAGLARCRVRRPVDGALTRSVPVRLPPDYGFGPWQTDNSGRQFREAEAVSSLFVDPAVTSVEIPMRLRDDRPAGSALVAVIVPGFSRTETRIGSEWTMQAGSAARR